MSNNGEGKLVLKSSFMDKAAVMEVLKTNFGHNKFRSDEQKKAIFTLIGGEFLSILKKLILHHAI